MSDKNILKLTLDKLEVKELVDLGTFLDKQDPQLSITVGNNPQHTKRVVDKGTEAKFIEVFQYDFSESDYNNDIEIDFEVSHENTFGRKTHLGNHKVALKKLIEKFNESIDIQVDLLFKKEGTEIKKGKVVFRGMISSSKPESAKDKKNKDTNTGKFEGGGKSNVYTGKSETLILSLEGLEAKDLVDKGTILDKQDPSLQITIGKQHFSTERMKDAGTEAKFKEHFDFEFDASAYNDNLEMEVEVFNQNLAGHRTHLGKGAISLRPFIAVSKGKEFTDMKVPLTFEGKQKGFVMMKGHLEAGEEVQELQVVKKEETVKALNHMQVVNNEENKSSNDKGIDKDGNKALKMSHGDQSKPPTADKSKINASNLNGSSDNPIIDYVCRKLAASEKIVSDIRIRVKSVFFSSRSRGIDIEKVATIKLSILPIPGKPIAVLSSYAPVMIDNALGLYEFDFNLKSALLTMGLGDIRSGAYKNGPCPTLYLEFDFTVGEESLMASGSVSLLNLVSDFSGDVVAVKLQTQRRRVELLEEEVMSLTAVLEINSDKDEEVRDIKQDSQVAALNINSLRLSGSGVKQLKCDLFATLRTSATTTSIADFNSNNSKRKITMQTLCPSLDVLELRLQVSGSEETLGLVTIPVAAIPRGGDGRDMDLSFNMWLLDNSQSFPSVLTTPFRLSFTLIATFTPQTGSAANSLVYYRRYQRDPQSPTQTPTMARNRSKQNFSRSVGYGPSGARGDVYESGHSRTTSPTKVLFRDLPDDDDKGGRTGSRPDLRASQASLRSHSNSSPQRMGTGTGTLRMSNTTFRLGNSNSAQTFVTLANSGRGISSTTSLLSQVLGKTIQGSLMVFSQGFLSLSPFPVTTSFRLEVLFLPEGGKKELLGSKLVSVSKSSFAGFVEIPGMVSKDIAWALDQRQVGCLRLTLLGDGFKCRGLVDITSLIQGEEGVLNCLVPLQTLKGTKSGQIQALNDKETSGWLLVGLEFRNIDVTVANEDILNNDKKRRLRELWPSVMNLRKDTNRIRLRNTVLVHFCFDRLQITKSFMNYISSNRSSEFELFVKIPSSGSDNPSPIHCNCVFGGEVFSFDSCDTLVHLDVEKALSVVAFLYLKDVARNEVVGECSFLIPYTQLANGIPVDFELPVKNVDNHRIGMVSFSTQSSFPNKHKQVSSSPPQVEIQAEILSGNIGGNDIVEPFFELSYLGFGSRSQTHSNYRSRTGIAALNVDTDLIGVSCSIYIPKPVSTTDSEEVDEEEDSENPQTIEKCHRLSVVCRDASSPDCPEIGRVVVFLSESFVTECKSELKLVDLTPPYKSSRVKSQMNKINLKMTVVTHQSNSMLSSNYGGIGFVSYELKGMLDIDDSDSFNVLSSVTASIEWPNDTMKEKASRSRFTRELAFFNNDNFFGSLPIDGALNSIQYSMNSEISNKTYQVDFPCMLAVSDSNNHNLKINVNTLTPNTSSSARSNNNSNIFSPKLELTSSFVPFSTVNLKIEYNRLEILDSSSFPKKAINSDLFDCIFRFSLGSNSPNFIFSKVVEASRNTGFTVDPLRRGPTSPTRRRDNNNHFDKLNNRLINKFGITSNYNSHTVEINVDTLRYNVENPNIQKAMVPLCVELFSAYNNKQLIKLGICGFIPTAAFYYEAIRSAITARTYHSPFVSDEQCTYTISSPIKLFDVKKKKQVAILHINLKFKLLNISLNVIKKIQISKSIELSDIRSELELKDYFLDADPDRKGSVSARKLLHLIKNSGKVRNKSISMSRSSNTLFSHSNSAHSSGKETLTHISNYLLNKFGKDNDENDGVITWWEWLVLIRSSNSNHEEFNSSPNLFLDPVVITLLAAYEALNSMEQDKRILDKSDELNDIQFEVVNFDDYNGSMKYLYGKPTIPERPHLHSPKAISNYKPHSNNSNSSEDNFNKKKKKFDDVYDRHYEKMRHNEMLRLELRDIAADKFRKVRSKKKIEYFLEFKFLPKVRDIIRRKNIEEKRLKAIYSQSLLDKEEERKKNDSYKKIIAKAIRRKIGMMHRKRYYFAKAGFKLASKFEKKNLRYFFNRFELICYELKLQDHARRLAESLNKYVKNIVRLSFIKYREICLKLKKQLVARVMLMAVDKYLDNVVKVSFLKLKFNYEKLIGNGKKLRIGHHILKRSILQFKLVYKKCQKQRFARLILTAIDKHLIEVVRFSFTTYKLRVEAIRLREQEINNDRKTILTKFIERMIIIDEKNQVDSLRLAFLKYKENCDNLKIQENIYENKVQRMKKVKDTVIGTIRNNLEKERDENHKKRIADLKNLKEIKKTKNDFSTFEDEKNKVIYCEEKPVIEKSVGYWVKIRDNYDAVEMGKVVKVDTVSRLVEIELWYSQENSTDPYKHTSKQLPFDHPDLEWYHMHSTIKKPIISLPLSASVSSEDDQRPITQRSLRPDPTVDVVEKPTLPNCTNGYVVAYYLDSDDPNKEFFRVVDKDLKKREIAIVPLDDPSQIRWISYDKPNMIWYKDIEEEISPPNPKPLGPETIKDAFGWAVAVYPDKYLGLVVGVNEKTNKVKIKFKTQGDDDQDDIEYLDWLSPEIRWLPPEMRSEVIKLYENRPAQITDAIGYSVEVADMSNDAGAGDMFLGTVIAVNPLDNSITIQFQTNINDPYEIEEYSWDSLEIIWRSKKPWNITDSIGYNIQTPSTDPNAQLGDMFYGKVIDFNESEMLIRVKFFASDDSSIQDDIEEFAFESPDIVWGDKPPRPLSIADSLGLTVQIKSRDPGTNYGDMYEAKIIDFNESKNLIRVKFFGEDDASIDDFAEYDWDSPDIIWTPNYVAMRKILTNEIPIVEPVGPIPNRPEFISQSIGYKVEVKNEDSRANAMKFFPGTVADFDERNNKIQVKFIGDDDISVEKEYDWDSRKVVWIPPILPKKIFNKPIIIPSQSKREENVDITSQKFKKNRVKFIEDEVARLQRPQVINDWNPPIALTNKANRPASIDQALNYQVEVKSTDPDAIEGDRFPGKVVDINEKENKIKVKFIGEDDASIDDFEIYDWDSEDVFWVAPTSLRPANILQALNYTVEVKSTDPGAVEGDLFVGKVINVSERNKKIRVKFFDDDDASIDDFEEFDWDSNDIVKWIPPTLSLFIPNRPATIVEAINYNVEIRITDSNANIGDVFLAKVVDVNEPNNKIRVKFIGDDDASIEDYEEYDWDNEEIVWIPPIISLVIPNRPDNIHQAVNCNVEVRSNNPNAESGEFFPAKVVQINERENKIRVKFFGDDDASIDDFEEYDWDSLDVVWLPPNLPPLFSNRPASIQEAINYKVEVKNKDPNANMFAFFQGKVVNINERNNKIKVKFFDDDDASIDDFEEYDWDSPDVVWIAPIFSEKFKNRPSSINQSVGYKVEVKNKDPNANMFDFFPAKVVDINQRNNKIKVKFFDDDDASIDDFEEYDWDSPDVVWIAPIFSEKFKNRPASINQSVGYNVEVKNKDLGENMGEFFQGKVIAFNERENMIRVKYFGDDGSIEDYEEYDWDSLDVMWFPTIFTSNRPASIQDALNYKVEVKSNNPNAYEVFQGKVINISEKDNTIKVKFFGDDDASIEDYEEYDWDSPDVVWIAPLDSRQFIHRPISIRHSIGCKVEVKNKILGDNLGEFFQAKVIDINEEESKIRVKFFGDDDASIDDFEEYDWNSPDVVWLPPNLPPLFSNRPASIQEAVNYRVEVKGSDPNADIFEGKVVNINERNNKIKVKFFGDDDVSIEDFEEYDWDSPNVVWIGPIIPSIVSNRPANIQDALNYKVEVKNADGDASESDFFQGKVINISEKDNTIKVKFFGDDDASIEDFEEFDWDSPDVVWIAPLDIEKFKNRPTSIQQSVGFRVEVKNTDADANMDEFFQGKVVAINEIDNKIRVKFIGDDDVSIEDFEEYNWDNEEIVWIPPILPPIISHRPANIRQSLNYRVEVKNKDSEPDVEDFFAGKVVEIIERENKVRIKFIGDDDASIEDFENYDWDSPDIVWIPPLEDRKSNLHNELEIIIVKAVGLPKRTNQQAPNVFVRVQFPGHSDVVTQTLKNNCFPEFNMMFAFPFVTTFEQLAHLRTTNLQVSVLDSEVNNEKVIGNCNVSLSDLVEGSAIDELFQINSTDKKRVGQLQLIARWRYPFKRGEELQRKMVLTEPEVDTLMFAFSNDDEDGEGDVDYESFCRFVDAPDKVMLTIEKIRDLHKKGWRPSTSFKVGDKVEGNYKGKGRWYSGKIRIVREDGSYDIDYDDGEKETAVPANLIRAIKVPLKRKLLEGSKVEANYKGKGKYYPGRVKRDRGDGTFDIDYDDGEFEMRVSEDMIRLKDNDNKVPSKKEVSYEVGDKVEGNYKGKEGKWYPGKIKRVRFDGTYDVDYNDGESETQLTSDLIRPIGGASDRSSPIRKARIEEGLKVEANYKGKGRWYPGRVKRDRGDGTFDIDYDDGEFEMRAPEDMIRLKDNDNKVPSKKEVSYEVGDKVEGNYKGKGKWYPGKVKRVRFDGTYDVDYNDGESETSVSTDSIRAVGSSPSRKARIEEGSKVEANYKGKGRWYPGKVKRDRGDGTFDIDYDDGEFEMRVSEDMIRVLDKTSENLSVGNVFSVDEKVEGNYNGNGRWYPGKVVKVNSDGTYELAYNDGESEREVSASRVRSVRPVVSSSTASSAFKAGDKVEGNYKEKGRWFPGKIRIVRVDGSYDIDYDDGEEETAVPANLIRAIAVEVMTFLGVSFKASDLSGSLDSDHVLNVEHILKVLISTIQKKGIDIKEAFRYFDTVGGDGFISSSKLMIGLEKLNVANHVPEYKNEIPQLFDKINTSGDSRISMDEFIQFFSHNNIVKKFKDVMLSTKDKGVTPEIVFALFDSNSNGKISLDEFGSGLRKNLPSFKEISDNDIHDLVSAIDKNKTGSISLTEFVYFIQNEDSPKMELQSYKVGDKVDGNYANKGRWFPGKIKRVWAEGTYDIDYDDGEMETEIPIDLIQAIAIHLKLSEGDHVDANYKGKGKWYPGRVKRDRGDGTFDIDYDDGEFELRVPRNMIRLKDNPKPVEIDSLVQKFRHKLSDSMGSFDSVKIKQVFEEIDLDRNNTIDKTEFGKALKLLDIDAESSEIDRIFERYAKEKRDAINYNEFLDLVGYNTSSNQVKLAEGSKVEANYKGKGRWYPGRVKRDRGDGTFDIDYDDGEFEMRVSEDMIRLKVDDRKGWSSGKPSLLVGDKIEGNYKGKGRWYPGKIKRVRFDGSYDIDYDDGEFETAVSTDSIRLKDNNDNKVPSKKDVSYEVGDKVEGNYRGKGRWYPGKIKRVRFDGTYDVDFDDGESETQLTSDLIRPVGGASERCSPIRKARIEEGSKVEANYKGKGRWYPGRVKRDRGDGTFDIDYDDGEFEMRVSEDMIRLKDNNNNNNNNNNDNNNNENNGLVRDLFRDYERVNEETFISELLKLEIDIKPSDLRALFRYINNNNDNSDKVTLDKIETILNFDNIAGVPLDLFFKLHRRVRELSSQGVPVIRLFQEVHNRGGNVVTRKEFRRVLELITME